MTTVAIIVLCFVACFAFVIGHVVGFDDGSEAEKNWNETSVYFRGPSL